MPKYDSPPYDSLGIHYTLDPQQHVFNPFFTGRPRSPVDPSTTPTTDRHEIIRRIKNDNSQRHADPPPSPEDVNQMGLDITRPRSALHRGDFHEDSPSDQPLSTSPVVPWLHQSPFARPRAVSQVSLSGSFSYQPPTSPLVHQANAADIPDYPTDHYPPPRPVHPHYPRHTSLRNFPYQAHQPRRSIGSIGSLPQSPFPASRRPSITDASPLQHAPMVGSYEESILRGRMSTTPSKPLDFVAQIGVLGKGDCKPSLKCPPHVAIPFPAVFYSYSSGTRTDPEPSPYVGMVDLENNLKKPDDPEAASKRRRRHLHEDIERASSCIRDGSSNPEDEKQRKRRQHKLDRRTSNSTSKSAPGGCYRIPAQGQLQIVIKNPNKTAVKLFLVPYDLSDMEPGTKTFIRQRSYSAGPVVDMPLSARRSYHTSDDSSDRPVLRYLIHLHICCPSKGRYYLYQNMRIVFANRVPDGKEKLRTETTTPEPRYSIFKPTAPATNDTTAADAAAAAKRRRSAVFPSHHLQHQHYHETRASSSMDSGDFGSVFGYSDSTSYNFLGTRLETLESRPASRGDMDVDAIEMEQRFTFEREAMTREVPKAESLLSRKLRDLEMRSAEHGF